MPLPERRSFTSTGSVPLKSFARDRFVGEGSSGAVASTSTCTLTATPCAASAGVTVAVVTAPENASGSDTASAGPPATTVAFPLATRRVPGTVALTGAVPGRATSRYGALNPERPMNGSPSDSTIAPPTGAPVAASVVAPLTHPTGPPRR